MAPPMTEKDTKIIFMNVADIAMFADIFSERLEEALGSVLEGGSGEDHVGALFLEMVCQQCNVPDCSRLRYTDGCRYHNLSLCTALMSRGTQQPWST